MNTLYNNEKEKAPVVWILILLIANIIVFSLIIFYNLGNQNALYFFNVGRSDSSMILHNNVRFVIDTGNKNNIINSLEKVMSPLSKYIDVVIVSTPASNYSEGLLSLLKYYKIGIVLYNGKQNNLWDRLKSELARKNIPYIALKRGDTITYKDAVFNILWPEKISSNYSSELADSSMLIHFCDRYECVLYAGSMTNKTENIINNSSKIKSYILNISNSSLKHSLLSSFIKNVSPGIVITESGKNDYDKIIKSILSQVSNINVNVFAIENYGIIKIVRKNNMLKTFKVE